MLIVLQLGKLSCKLSVTDLWLALQDHRSVLCPAVLDMAAYVASGTFGMVSTKYDAVAFVKHQGQAPTCGHYSTITRPGAGSDCPWSEHDDGELRICKQPFAASSTICMALYQRQSV